MKENSDNGSEREIQLDELLPWFEFACWTALALFPFLYWVNGPAVSTDQFVVRSILVVVASVGAVGMRYRNWRIGSREPSPDGKTADEAQPAER